MKRAEACRAGGAGEIDRLMRPLVDPKRRLDRAAALARRDFAPVARAWGGGESRRQNHAGFLEAQIALLLDGGLRQFADDDERSEWRQGAHAPRFRCAERLDEFRGKLERQALVA